MASPFGYVLQADTDFDKRRFEQHVSITKPASLTIINNAPYAVYLKQNVIPQSEVYIRNIDIDGDGNDFDQYTPETYFNKYAPLTGGVCGLQFCNEPAFNPDTAQRMLPFFQEAVKRQIKVSGPGIAVGNTPPSPDGWSYYHDFLDYVCHHPFYITLDMHEYFGGLPTSGMITRETRGGDVLYFSRELKKPEQWQPKTIADFTNTYHVGRCQHAFTYARSKGWDAPVIDISEFGADFVRDNDLIETWLRGLPSIGAPNVEGYKTLQEYWRREFPQWTLQQSFYEMLSWLWTHILKPIGVRSTRLFVWNDGSRWKNFNVSNDSALLLWFETFSIGSNIPTTPIPTPTPLPTPPIPPVVPDKAHILEVLNTLRIKGTALQSGISEYNAILDQLINSLNK